MNLSLPLAGPLGLGLPELFVVVVILSIAAAAITAIIWAITRVCRQKADIAPDLYTDLSKLDDLRKRGVLTEEEFLAQKRRRLEK
jgi:hypothetical protein